LLLRSGVPMDKMKAKPPLPDGLKLPTLSSAGYNALRLLRRGCAYQARGAWRFRGSPSRTNNKTLDALLASGLAERVDDDQPARVQITAAGRLLNKAPPA